MISPLGKGNAYDSKISVNRSSDLKTLQQIFQLGPYLDPKTPESEYGVGGPGHFNNVPNVHDLSDLFIPGTIPTGLPKLNAAADHSLNPELNKRSFGHL